MGGKTMGTTMEVLADLRQINLKHEEMETTKYHGYTNIHMRAVGNESAKMHLL